MKIIDVLFRGAYAIPDDALVALLREVDYHDQTSYGDQTNGRLTAESRETLETILTAIDRAELAELHAVLRTADAQRLDLAQEARLFEGG